MTGQQLLAADPKMSWWTPFEFSMGKSIIFNTEDCPKSEFMIFRGLEMKFRSISLQGGLDVESMVLDIEQVTIVRNAKGELNFQLPPLNDGLISTIMIDEVVLKVKTALYYDYTTSDNPVPTFFHLNHTSKAGPVTSYRQLAHVILRPSRFIVENLLGDMNAE